MAKTTFVDGNPQQQILGTVVTAEFLNALNNHRHMGLDQDGDGALDYASDTGMANTYVFDLTPALTAYITGMPMWFKAAHTNTGASTAMVNGLGEKSIKARGAALPANTIVAGQIYCLVYDGANLQLVSDTGLSAVPVGSVAWFAASSAPAGYLKANGAAISRTTYAALYAIVGTTYGEGDGGTTFNLPDLRGEFVRGFDDGRGVDSGRTIGSAQAGAYASHSHKNGVACSGTSSFVYASTTTGMPGSATHEFHGGFSAAPTYQGQTSSDGSSETRPRNIALLACIKY